MAAPETKPFHNFNLRDEKLPLFKDLYINMDSYKKYNEWLNDDLEQQKRHGGEVYTWKLKDKTRQKINLATIYKEDIEPLKNFLQEVMEIKLPKEGGWEDSPESQLKNIIDKYTTENFNPRNYLSNGYLNSDTGELAQTGAILFFTEYNIKEAEKLLNYLNKFYN